MADLTIVDLNTKKMNLQEAIAKLMNEFTDKTGAVIDEWQLRQIPMMDNNNVQVATFYDVRLRIVL